jgi:hypothetical protein
MLEHIVLIAARIAQGGEEKRSEGNKRRQALSKARLHEHFLFSNVPAFTPAKSLAML